MTGQSTKPHTNYKTLETNETHVWSIGRWMDGLGRYGDDEGDGDARAEPASRDIHLLNYFVAILLGSLIRSI